MPDGELDLRGLAPSDVTGFVLAQCPQRSPGSAKLLVTALRSLLRFLHVEGMLPRPLSDAVPSVAGWRLAGLPRALDAGQTGRLLASCGRSSMGSRDFAVLTLLVPLGLRAGEVGGLQLGDIDWRHGEITVRGKGNQRERLPLPVDVGQALVAYLRSGRPASMDGCRRLFLSARAPLRGLTSSAVSLIVSRAASRAGLPEITAHRLRHTAATRLLEARAPTERSRSIAPSPSPVDYRDLCQGQPGGPQDCCPLLARRCSMRTLRDSLVDYLTIRRVLGYKLRRHKKLLA